MRSLLLAVALLACAAAPATAASVATLGSGHHPGVALDGGGTAYVAWKTEVPGPDFEETVVEFCTVAPRARTCAAPPVRVPFERGGYYTGAVVVSLGPPGVVEVVVGRGEGLNYGAHLARSVDGGRTFALGTKVGDANAQASTSADRLPDGRLVAGFGDIRGFGATVTPADGSQADREAVPLGANGFFSDTAVDGGDVVAAGGARETQAFRLPAGADAFVREAWRPYPALPGGRVRIDGGPAGAVALLDSEPAGVDAPLYAQRLEPAGLGPAVTIARPDKVLATEMVQQRDGQLSALWTDGDALHLARSEDGGARWSSRIDVARLGDADVQLAAEVDPAGAGAAVFAEATGDPEPIRLARFRATEAPQATVTVGDARVQVRSRCARGRRLTLEARASRGARAVPVGGVLRSATFAGRRARVARRGRFAARATLRSARSRSRVVARLRPRGGGRTVRVAFAAAGCSASL